MRNGVVSCLLIGGMFSTAFVMAPYNSYHQGPIVYAIVYKQHSSSFRHLDAMVNSSIHLAITDCPTTPPAGKTPAEIDPLSPLSSSIGHDPVLRSDSCFFCDGTSPKKVGMTSRSSAAELAVLATLPVNAIDFLQKIKSPTDHATNGSPRKPTPKKSRCQ